MRYVKYSLIGLIALFFSGCLTGASNSTYTFAINQDLEEFEKFRKSGGDVNKYYNSLGNLSPNKTILGLAVAGKKFETVKYVLEHGADVNDPRNKTSGHYIQGYELISMAFFNKDRRMIKILLDYGAPTNNFILYQDYYHGEYRDRSTSCGVQQYVCDNQRFAKQYYKELQTEKEQVEQEKVNIQKNDEIDSLLGI